MFDGDSGGDESDDAVESSSVEVAGAISGFGQTLSLLSSGQNSRILSKRYCRRSLESPGGWISCGKSLGSGFQ